LDHVLLLRQLPLALTPFLLKEIIGYDWKFPAEQFEIDGQLSYLDKLPSEDRQREMAPFAHLRLNAALENSDWVNEPGGFIEQLSAHLWASNQMDVFRAASEVYVNRFHRSLVVPQLPAPRLGIVLIGRGVLDNRYTLFRKLRREGVYFTNVKPEGGWQAILGFVRGRAEKYPIPYGHWYIDGGAAGDVRGDRLTCVSYQALSPARAVLAGKMQRAYESPTFGAEALRSLLARMRPEDLEMQKEGTDPVLNRFQVSLLTEGAGTQIYSTTFVQWAAREVYRRAQPITLLARFQPRVRERPMNELLEEVRQKAELDAHGSLIDADMGAYYTGLNQQRLSGAHKAVFLAWFEEHAEAVAVGSALPRGTVDATETELAGLLHRIA
jgi:hypothetical protein